MKGARDEADGWFLKLLATAALIIGGLYVLRWWLLGAAVAIVGGLVWWVV